MADGKLFGRLGAFIGRHRLMKGVFGLYPPFVGAGVRLSHVSSDLRVFDVEMPLRPWNRNYKGTHFGGSLYAMCDPFFMIILIENLGPDYVIWDKAGSIRFLKPGTGTVRAHFEISPERIAEVRAAADETGKTDASFSVDVLNEAGETVARCEKVISVRRKR